MRRIMHTMYRIVCEIPMMVIIADAEGKIEFANRRYTEVTGYTADEVLGKDLWSLQCPEMSGDVCDDLQRRVLAGEEWQGELVNWRKNGQLYWESASISSISDESGITHIVVFKQEITDRKIAEERLFESEERFKAFMDNNPAIAWMKDENGRYVYINKAYEQRFGVSRESWLGRSTLEVWPEETAWSLWEHDRHILATGRVVDSIEKLPTPEDQDSSWWFFRFPFLDRRGKKHVGGIAIDITQRRRTEDALRHSEELLRHVLETLPVGVTIQDRTGAIVTCNRAAQDIWGGMRFVEMERFGEYKGWWLASGKRISAEEWAAARAITRGEVSLDEEIEIEGFNGVRKIILNSAIPMRDAQGEISGAIVVNQDVTEHKKAELELQKAKEELDVRVRERTAELARTYGELHHETEERLRAVEELRRKDQILLHQNRLAAMGEMLGNIAHQWRQPLNVIGLLVQDLPLTYDHGTFSREYLQETVEKAMEVIAHMSKTIDDFRNFFRPDKGKALFKVNDVVASTVSLLQAGLKEEQMAVEIVEEEEVVVAGYPNEFSHVVLNILMNARDAMRERQVREPAIRIAIFREKEMAVVTIADNAGGIPEEIMGKIFEPYFTTKGPDKGTGIGLFMSKNIIEKNMDGSLDARNTGDGAEFRIRIPTGREQDIEITS